jgi:hypothetical protein
MAENEAYSLLYSGVANFLSQKSGEAAMLNSMLNSQASSVQPLSAKGHDKKFFVALLLAVALVLTATSVLVRAEVFLGVVSHLTDTDSFLMIQIM